MNVHVAVAQSSTAVIPLVVDLDGTLVKTDTLVESICHTLPTHVADVIGALRALGQGKAAFKAYFAEASHFDYTLLPYDAEILDLIEKARREGRPVYLASACDRRHATGVADHLGVFDGVFASDGETNLSGHAKADRLVQEFGEAGFDYVGDSSADVAVWLVARSAFVTRATRSTLRKLQSAGIEPTVMASADPGIRTWIRALRVHQYVKNALVLVPLLTAHAFDIASFGAASIAFLAFSACASGVYILNDLVDLDADRGHPRKKSRPFAAGDIPIAHAAVAVPLLLSVAATLAISVSWRFAGVLLAYFALTTAYSLWLKRKMLLDAVVLALLYTTRVVGGAVAIQVVVSEWLLAFSTFMFLALGLMKRYVELGVRIDASLSDPSNRDYKLGDTAVIAALAAASGFNAITIFSLYIASPTVQALYSRPAMLWLICPILIYWTSRALMLAHRRVMDDDPIVFALRDRVSRIAVVSMAGIVLAAI